MTSQPLKVILTRKLPEEVEARLSDLFDVMPYNDDSPMSQSALLAAVQGCDVLACTLGDRIDAQLLAQAGPQLKLIANFGAGVDHIDVQAAAAQGITVTNTPSVLAEDAADMAMALIMAVPRRLVEGVEALRQGRFVGWSPTWMLGHRVRGKKLGIIGLGRVGQAVARRARAFGLSVHYHNRNRINPHVENELEATYWESLDQMLPRVDIVCVNCPQTPATYHLLSRRRLELLHKDAYIVNVSRGNIIDEEALADMIVEKRLGGAGLDVFSREPAVNEKLMAAPNAVLLPHMASATVESRIDMGDRMLINIKMFADGHKPPDRIIPEML
ncbi:D-glycerate dehydrogenase [Parvularcula sp. IMCC14364]|uniref:2-hydroxyacid dehydrogenase n=1 Tax=Parvularcula sp. IMCC14364 TaxID=3067902 RepID=UPI0027425726|nr:D-glycerate dehydrogenase [Parvularcula sp. IMCC14364]